MVASSWVEQLHVNTCPRLLGRTGRDEAVASPAPPCLATTSQAYVPALKGVDLSAAIAEPVLFPDQGIWHPLAPNMYEDLKEYLNW